jgi:hypothetical protein
MKGEKGLPGAPGQRVSVWMYSLVSLWVCLPVALRCAKIDEIVLIHMIDALSLVIVLERELPYIHICFTHFTHYISCMEYNFSVNDNPDKIIVVLSEMGSSWKK